MENDIIQKSIIYGKQFGINAFGKPAITLTLMSARTGRDDPDSDGPRVANSNRKQPQHSDRVRRRPHFILSGPQILAPLQPLKNLILRKLLIPWVQIFGAIAAVLLKSPD